MSRILWTILVAAYLAQPALTQERKIEISPFAGGYFSAGYQSGGIDSFGVTETLGEPHSGIFGVRGSHDLTQSLSLEGTIGFSPAGQRIRRDGAGFIFVDIEDFLTGLYTPASQAGDTYHYAGNILYKFYNRGSWAPFFTSGAGAVTRTAEERTSGPRVVPYLSLYPSINPVTQTNLSLNIGGGVKKYFTDRCGIRFDFRSYISQPSGDTVNNMELSFGLIFKL